MLARIKRWLSRRKLAPVARHVNTNASFKVHLDDNRQMVISMGDGVALMQITLPPEYVATFVDIGLDSIMADPDIVVTTEQLIELEPGPLSRMH